MRYLLLVTLVLISSCNFKKTLLLPEINQAHITEVLDVSPIYLFYDVTKKDSVDLNRSNVITATNWLVNVDKRLTLGQVVPKIIPLQDKKRKAEIDKTENTKNYYTCNDLSIANLGFLDFTNTIYNTNAIVPNIAVPYGNAEEKRFIIDFINPRNMLIVNVFKDSIVQKSTLQNLIEDLENLPQDGSYEFFLNLNKNMSFQDYITLKSKLMAPNAWHGAINENEFIY